MTFNGSMTNVFSWPIYFYCILVSCTSTVIIPDYDLVDEEDKVEMTSIWKPDNSLLNSYTDNGTTFSSQGMAVCGDLVYRLFHSGYCQRIDVSDLQLPKVIDTSELGSFSRKNHGNCAQIFVDSAEDTLLYVSSAQYISGEQGKCYVEHINNNSFELIQTISLSFIDILKNYSGIDIICGDDGFLWAFGFNHQGKNMIFLKARKPSIQEGRLVFLNNSDVYDYWIDPDYSYDTSVTQGGCVHCGHLYSVFGTATTNRHIAVYNTASHHKVGDIDINSFVREEPEDCDFIGDNLLISINGGKGFYLMSLSYYGK